MGCTSSTPGMIVPQTNSTEKNISFSQDEETGTKGNERNEDEKEIKNGSDNNLSEIKVLPTCDSNLVEPLPLLARNSSKTNVEDLSDEKDPAEDASEINTADIADNLQLEEKLVTLEDVVERVVELYVTDSLENKGCLKDTDTCNAEERVDIVKKDDHLDKTENFSTQNKDEISEGTISPSQSESSRATRWEALADIAAELPPSLAVDPHTGQIYSLSK